MVNIKIGVSDLFKELIKQKLISRWNHTYIFESPFN